MKIGGEPYIIVVSLGFHMLGNSYYKKVNRMKIGRSKGGGWWIFPVPGWGKDNLYPKYVYYKLKLIIKFFTLSHHYELEREKQCLW